MSLFLSARRGGRFIYALDVTDPADPKFLWKKSSTQYRRAGLHVVHAQGGAPSRVRQSGRDLRWRLRPERRQRAADRRHDGPRDLHSRRHQRHLVWKAEYSGGGGTSCIGNPCNLSGMTYAIASDVTLVNRDFDTSGYIDRIYATDLGGNIWRVDLEPAGYAARWDPSGRRRGR